MLKFKLSKEFHLTSPLKEGQILYKFGDENEIKKSLYIPGIGRFPMNKEVSEHACNDPKHLTLYCDETCAGLKSIIGYDGLTDLYVLQTWGAPMPCDRLDIFCHYKGVTKEIKFYHYAINNEPNCSHLKYCVGEDRPKEIVVFDYYIVVDGIRIYASEVIVNYIQNNGFDGVRIDEGSFGLYLRIPNESQKADFAEYDRLQIKLNGYNVPTYEFGGIEPYYYLEDEKWWDENNRRQILKCKPQVVSEITPGKTFDKPIEDEINELVVFFSKKHFTRSSQVSNYITDHNLGRKYPHITGDLEMTNGWDTWILPDGIAPEYYAEIIRRLNIGNNESGSWPIGFKPNGDK